MHYACMYNQRCYTGYSLDTAFISVQLWVDLGFDLLHIVLSKQGTFEIGNGCGRNNTPVQPVSHTETCGQSVVFSSFHWTGDFHWGCWCFGLHLHPCRLFEVLRKIDSGHADNHSSLTPQDREVFTLIPPTYIDCGGRNNF